MTDPAKTPHRVCPGCESAMQILAAGDTRIDRCFFCGGVYLDKGELTTLAGKPIDVGAAGTPGKRTCAGCGAALAQAKVGPVTIDLCGSCGGIYLDAGELKTLAGEIDLKQVEKPKTHEAITFICPGCGETFDTDEGIVTPEGLACVDCAPGLSSLGGEDLVAPAYGGGWVTLNDGDPGTAEVKTLGLVVQGLAQFL